MQPRCPRPDQLSPASSAHRGGRAPPSPLLRASTWLRRRARDGASAAGLANASQAWRARARTTRHNRTCPPCPCAHNAARPHLQRGVDGREQVTTVPRRQAREGHVACAPAGGRVSDPSTGLRTPARDKQRRVQPRCPRPDQLSPASSAHRGGRAASSSYCTVYKKFPM